MSKIAKIIMILVFGVFIGILSGMFLVACIEGYCNTNAAGIEDTQLYKDSMRFHSKFSDLGVKYGYFCRQEGMEQTECIDRGEEKLIGSFTEHNIWPDNFKRRKNAVRSYNTGIMFVFNRCYNDDYTIEQCNEVTMGWIEQEVRAEIRRREQ